MLPFKWLSRWAPQFWPLSSHIYRATEPGNPSPWKLGRRSTSNGQLAVLFEAILQVTSHKVMFQNMWQILDHPKNTLKVGWHLEDFPLLWWFQLSGLAATELPLFHSPWFHEFPPPCVAGMMMKAATCIKPRGSPTGSADFFMGYSRVCCDDLAFPTGNPLGNL